MGKTVEQLLKETREKKEKQGQDTVEGEWRPVDTEPETKQGLPKEKQTNPKPEKKEKGDWHKIMTWMFIIVCLLAIAFFVIYGVVNYRSSIITNVSLLEPTEGSSVQGPLARIKFSADRKIDLAEMTTFAVKDAEDIDVLGSFSDKGKVKEFYWTPSSSLEAGEYSVKVGGEKVPYHTFHFKVFEVEKATDTDTSTSTTTTTPAAKIPTDTFESLMEKIK